MKTSNPNAARAENKSYERFAKTDNRTVNVKPSQGETLRRLMVLIRRTVIEIRQEKHVSGLSLQAICQRRPKVNPEWVRQVAFYETLPLMEWDQSRDPNTRSICEIGLTGLLQLAEQLEFELSVFQRNSLKTEMENVSEKL